MTLSRRNFSFAVTFAAGLTLGIIVVVAIQSFSTRQERQSQGITQRDVHQSSIKRGANIPAEANVEIEKLQELFRRPSTVDQYRLLYTTMSLATEAELNNWWNQAQIVERESHRGIAQQVIIGKLAAINPKKALGYLDDVSKFQIDALLNIVFSEWSVLRLDEAVEAATKLPRPRRNAALLAILETRDDLPDNERLSIAKQLDGEESYLNMVSDTQAAHLIAKPEESWSILRNDDLEDSLQSESFAKVATVWYEEIGFEVLVKIHELGLFGIRDELVYVITRDNIEGALNYAQGLLDENVRESLSKIIIRDWARTDAQAALAAASSFEPSSLASDLEGEVAITWARVKPIELIENIERVPGISRLWSLETAFIRIARNDPPKAISMLSSVENFVGNTSSILTGVVETWAQQQPNAATDWVLNHSANEDPDRQQLLGRVLPYLAEQNPVQAFELALEEPDPKDGRGLERSVIQRMAYYGDIELAKKLLPRVRENSKSPSYIAVATAMVDLDQTSEALELGKELKESEQQSFFQQVLSRWALRKPKNLYESLKNLSSKNIQDYAAEQLIYWNRYYPILTDDQIDHVRSFLTPDDEAGIKR